MNFEEDNAVMETLDAQVLLEPRTMRQPDIMTDEEKARLENIVQVMHCDADTMLDPPLVRRMDELPLDEQQDILDNPYAMISSIERTPQGRLWNAWFGGSDGPKSFMAFAKSDDDGETWSGPEYIIQSSPSPGGIPRPIRLGCIWTDPLGRLWAFFSYTMVNYDGRAGVWATVCDNPDDDEMQWSEPRRIWHGTALNKPTVLNNGDWMLPIALWQREYMSGAVTRPATFFDTGDLCHTDLHRDLDPLRMSHAFVSSDNGKTWQWRGGFCQPQRCHDEHMFVELRDGRIWGLCRTTYGYLAESFSPDMGKNWGDLNASQIKCPSSRFFIRKLNSGNILLVHHDVPDSFPGDYSQGNYFNGRVNLRAWLSEDDGKTWKGGLLLDDQRDFVASPDGCQGEDGKIYITYEMTSRVQGGVFLAVFREEDVLAAKPVSKDCRLKLIVKKPK